MSITITTKQVIGGTSLFATGFLAGYFTKGNVAYVAQKCVDGAGLCFAGLKQIAYASLNTEERITQGGMVIPIKYITRTALLIGVVVMLKRGCDFLFPIKKKSE